MAYNVKFIAGTQAQYDAAAAIDANTLYFITDTPAIYKGTNKLTRNEAIGVLTSLKVDESARTNLVDAINAVYDIADANKTAIDKLNGTTDTTSVSKKITDAINAIKASDIEIDTIIGLTATNVQEALAAIDAKVGAAQSAGEVTVAKSTTAADVAAKYTISQNGKELGVIDIPKDMVVESGSVETYTDATLPAGVTKAGTYIVLTIANKESDKLYIPVDGLIEYVTSGSNAGDMIYVNVSADHKVTATITDGTITKAKLAAEVQTSLDKADAAATNKDFEAYKTSNDAAVKANADAITILNGKATVDGSVKKAVADAKTALEGTDDDTAASATIKGAKKYADDLNTVMDTRVDALESAVGEGGSVDAQIKTAIEGLDSTASQTAGADGLALSVTIADGKLTSISGSIAADTYDAAGAAKSAQDAAAVDATTKADAALASAKEYADGLASNYDAKGAADTAETNAKAYTDTALTWGTF